MSLEDEYLRNQLSEFRDQIGHILWFSSRPESDDILRWVIANRVEVFEVSDWSDFWAALSACPRKEDDLYVVQNWLTAFQAAFSETNAHFGALSSIPFMRKTGSSGADLASYQVHLANCGLEIPKLEDEGLTSPYGPNDATTVTALVNFFSAEQKKRGLPTLNGS